MMNMGGDSVTDRNILRKVGQRKKREYLHVTEKRRYKSVPTSSIQRSAMPAPVSFTATNTHNTMTMKTSERNHQRNHPLQQKRASPSSFLA
eukprot:m.134747 g.134747  ORF g.134747 m.134747 type:complete len:91 (+) comp29756_c0_seq3:49-321(+)